MKKKIFTVTILTALVCAFLAIGATSSAAQSPDRYGRTTATGNVAYAYDLIKEGVMAEVPIDKIEFDSDKNLTLEELRRAYALFSSDYPECFWLGTNYRYSQIEGEPTVLAMEPNYSFEGAELTEAKAAIRAKIDAIIEDMPDTSNYEKALYLHDAVAKNTEYKMVGEHQTAYGALVSNKAVCAGYAAAYQLLLNEAGIPAWTVSGVSYDPSTNEQMPHAWCVVWIDGVCLYTDVTWDDQGDELYHSYFCLEKSEMGKDHVVNSDVFSLPTCEHYGEGFFHKNGNIVTDSTTADEFALMFDTTKKDTRTSEFLYAGTGDFSDWLDAIFNELYFALGGEGTQSATYSFGFLGDEFHLTISGDMPIMTHTVSIFGGKNMSCSGKGEQTVTVGEKIEVLLFTADEGYYFPANYPTAEKHGITVERLSHSEIIVYGIPEKSISLTLEPATKKQKLNTPTATFTASGEDSGMLNGLSARTSYSIDGGENWVAAEGDSAIISSGIDASLGILLINKGDGIATTDSDTQKISLDKAALPYTAISHSATALGNDGKITGLSTRMEYKTEGGAWTGCPSDELDSLTPGVYYVRVSANGSTLASETLRVTVGAYTDAAVSGISLSVILQMELGKSYKAECVLTPDVAHNQTVYFSVDSEDVLQINALSGEISLKSRGRARIKVTSQNGALTAEAEVTVFCTHIDTVPDTTPLPNCRADESYFKCTACGQLFDSEMQEIDEVPKGHLFDKNARCDVNYHWYECSCGEVSNRDNHAFDEPVDFTDEDGEEVLKRTCTTCGYSVYEEVSSNKIIDFVKRYFLVIGGVAFFATVAIIALVKRKK